MGVLFLRTWQATRAKNDPQILLTRHFFYLGWRRALTGVENRTIDRLANKILEFINP